MARKKLTDKQKKKVVADYIECENYAAVGRKYGITGNYVKKLVKADPSSAEKFSDKKEKNTQDVLAYFDSQTENIKRLGDYIFDERLNPATSEGKELLNGTSLNDIMKAFGIMSDKMFKSKELGLKSRTEEQIEGINQNIQTLAELINSPAPNRSIEDIAGNDNE